MTYNGQRYATVSGARTSAEVAAYLPGNYAVLSEARADNGRLVVTIGGYDSHGWTLDDYVIPRLASGLMTCEETSC